MSEVIRLKCDKSFERKLRKIDRNKNLLIENGVVYLETTKDITAKFDSIDMDLANRNWYSLNGYIIRKNRLRNYVYMHNVILERILGISLNDNEEADHINGDRSDNRRANLRLLSHSENCANIRKSNKIKSTSKYKGVNFDKSKNKFRARITSHGITYHLGFFDDCKEAGTCLAPDQSFLNLPQNVFRPEKLNNMRIILLY